MRAGKALLLRLGWVTPRLRMSGLPRPRLLCPDLMSEPDVELLQNSSCKVDAATLKPASYPQHPEMEW